MSKSISSKKAPTTSTSSVANVVPLQLQGSESSNVIFIPLQLDNISQYSGQQIVISSASGGTSQAQIIPISSPMQTVSRVTASTTTTDASSKLKGPTVTKIEKSDDDHTEKMKKPMNTVTLRMPTSDEDGNVTYQTLNIPVQSTSYLQQGGVQTLFPGGSQVIQVSDSKRANTGAQPMTLQVLQTTDSTQKQFFLPLSSASVVTEQSQPSQMILLSPTRQSAPKTTTSMPSQQITMLANGQCVLINTDSSAQNTSTSIPLMLSGGQFFPLASSSANPPAASTTQKVITPTKKAPPPRRSPVNASKKRPAPTREPQRPTFKIVKTNESTESNDDEAIDCDEMCFVQDPHDPNKWRLMQSGADNQLNITNSRAAANARTAVHAPKPIKKQPTYGTTAGKAPPMVLTQVCMPNGEVRLIPARGVRVVQEAPNKNRINPDEHYPDALKPVRLSHIHIETPPELYNARRTACDCPNCEENKHTPGDPKHVNHKCHHQGCGKTYGKTSHLRAHLRSHEGKKPFVCSFDKCQKSFTRTDELQRHMRTHLGERNYHCVVCCKPFLRRDHVRKHMRTHPDFEGDILPPPNRRVSRQQYQPSAISVPAAPYSTKIDDEDTEIVLPRRSTRSTRTTRSSQLVDDSADDGRAVVVMSRNGNKHDGDEFLPQGDTVAFDVTPADKTLL